MNGFKQLRTAPEWEQLSPSEKSFVKNNWNNPKTLARIAGIVARAKKKADVMSAIQKHEPVKITVTLCGQDFPLEIENESCAKLSAVTLMKRGDVWEIVGSDIGGFTHPFLRFMDEFNEWAKTHPNIFRFAAIS